MSTSEEDAPDVVAKLLEEESQNSADSTATLVKPTTSLCISPSQNIDLTNFDVVISCTPEPLSSTRLKEARVKYYLPLKCQIGKLGSRDLRDELPLLQDFLSSLPAASSLKMLVTCPTGKDLSVGTALAILCLHTDESGHIDLSTRRGAADIDKNFIKQRLSWITTSNPALNPSRTTLQSVNSVLLTTQDPKVVSLPLRARPDNGTFFSGSNHEYTNTQEKSNDDPPQDPSLPSKLFAALSSTSKWSFHRTLTSTLPSHPSGTVTGNATFTPCSLPPSFPPTLLYAEEGEFVTNTRLKFNARRKYVYQLINNAVVVKFFDDEKLPRANVEDGVGKAGEGIGGMFVEMDALVTKEGEVEAKNKEQHLCAEDLYAASWRFSEGMTGGKGTMWWEVRYDVKGPKKDYVSWTRYERGV